ncbi:MAG: hypothetical protein IPK28_06395 [Devosia sp.]|nr:hypothetical protein [Devosia sp.]
MTATAWATSSSQVLGASLKAGGLQQVLAAQQQVAVDAERHAGAAAGDSGRVGGAGRTIEPAALRLADPAVDVVERREDALAREQQQQVEADVQRIRHRVRRDGRRNLLGGFVLVDHHHFGLDAIGLAPGGDGVGEQLVGVL